MHKQQAMICFPNAKINIGLNIISRKADGYHNIETLFYPIGLKDALEIIPSEASEHRFYPNGMEVSGSDEENLVMKALRLVEKERTLPPIDIHLLKKIPSGAGVGGGSSDAAFMLKLLNQTFRLDFSPDELTKMAASLGADCAFFIHNKPALATGIGDILEPVDIDLSSYFLLLVKPPIAVSTKEAYSMIVPQKPEVPLREIIKKPIDEWREWVKNDFERPLFQKYPEIHWVKQQLYELGAIYASMSGSGSSVYAFFHKEPNWEGAFKGCYTWASNSN